MLKQLILIIILLPAFSPPVYAYGPFDYTDPEHYRVKLPVVEQYHFNPDVENLRAGMTSAYVIDDLDYVLRIFPNHHRALNALAKLWQEYRKKDALPPGASPKKTPEYYFKRATRFSPKDGTVRLLYGIYLHRLGKLQEALAEYQVAEKLLPSSPELHYNLGLLYLDIKDLKQAKVYAMKAYEHNYPLMGLKRKLMKAGVWSEKKIN